MIERRKIRNFRVVAGLAWRKGVDAKKLLMAAHDAVHVQGKEHNTDLPNL